MPDLTTGALAGAVLIAVGALTAGAGARVLWARRPDPAGPGPAPEPHAGWEHHLGELEQLRQTTPTEMLPATDSGGGEPPAGPDGRGRHTADDHVPCHDVDTIGWRTVPAGWTPVIGAARIAAVLGETQADIPPATDTEVGR